MSVDLTDVVGVQSLDSDVGDLEDRSGPEPRAHGSAIMNVFNDLDGSGDPLYDRALDYWRTNVGDRDEEPYVVDDDFAPDWLPDDRYHLLLTSSRWKAGTFSGGSYRPYFKYHLKVRRVDDDGDYLKPPIALHVVITPQYRDLVYESDDPIECPYGEGTKINAWSTYAETAEAIEDRALDALIAAFDVDRRRLDLDRDHNSRRIAKAESHVRFIEDLKPEAVEAIENTKKLIAWGGDSKIDAAQKRQSQGWLEASCRSNRWDLLGFPSTSFDIKLKVYHFGDWHNRSSDDPLHHPKIEAAFAGVNDGRLPHVSQWDDVMKTLRTIVSSHLDWAGIERADLVEDDHFDGAAAPEYEYRHPVGRRSMLRRRYQDVATEIYRESMKPNTDSIFDILRVMVDEYGATYDVLERKTGLARSTIRYHAARLEDVGLVERIGNPVVLVFASDALLDRAREILREIKPEYQPSDLRDRAEDRRDRREQDETVGEPDPPARDRERDDGRESGRQSPESDDTSDGSDESTKDREPDDERESGRKIESDDDRDQSIGFEYLDRISGSLADVVRVYHDEQIDDEDIRIRLDRLPPDLR